MYTDGRVEIWDLSRQILESSKILDYNEIKRMAISPNDQILAIQNGESSVEIVSLLNDKQRNQITGTLPRGAPISPDNQMILIHAGDLQLYSLSPASAAHLFAFYEFPVNGSVNYSPDSAIVLAASPGIIKYWSASSGRELVSQSVISRAGNCQIINRQTGDFLAAGSPNGVVTSNINLSYFCSTTRGPRTLSEDFLNDGSIITLALENQLIEVWDLKFGSQKQTIKSSSPGNMLSVAISSNGNLLAAASAGGTIEIYDLGTMKLIKTLNMLTGPINQVLFSHDGKYLIAGLADGTTRFFGITP